VNHLLPQCRYQAELFAHAQPANDGLKLKQPTPASMMRFEPSFCPEGTLG
jgi:hypothetical protein